MTDIVVSNDGGPFSISAPAQGPQGVIGPGYAATSTTSLACAGSGSKAFATQAGLAYSAGARLRATSAGTGEWMEGVVTAYSGTTLTATMDLNSGAGTHADWDINLAGQQGQTGSTGPTGATGATGAGVPTGGTSGQVLAKNSSTDYDTSWQAAGGVPSGVVVFTILSTAPSGWLLFADQTIGDASSGATYANAAAQAVFTALFTNFSDANCPILTSAGGATTRAAQTDAATAWVVHCRMTMPKMLGRALAAAGSGSGLTSRALGDTTGAETVTLGTSQLPHLSYGVSATWNYENGMSAGGVGFAAAIASDAANNMVSSRSFPASSSAAVSVSVSDSNGGGSHNNMQPTSFLNAMIKL